MPDSKFNVESGAYAMCRVVSMIAQNDAYPAEEKIEKIVKLCNEFIETYNERYPGTKKEEK